MITLEEATKRECLQKTSLFLVRLVSLEVECLSHIYKYRSALHLDYSKVSMCSTPAHPVQRQYAVLDPLHFQETQSATHCTSDEPNDGGHRAPIGVACKIRQDHDG